MKKILKPTVFALTLGVILSLLAGLSTVGAAQVDKLRVTYVKLPLNVPTILVKRFGLLENEFTNDNIEVEWSEITSGGKQTQAMAASSIDIASVVSSTAAITARANGVGLKIIAIFARAPRTFNVVAIDPAIRGVADLKGKKVAGPKGSLLNQTLFAALMKSGLSPKDVGYVHMPVPKALAALVGGSVDAALVAGPVVPKAESQGGRIIANGEGLVKGLIVTAVRESFLQQHPDLINRYLKVQRNALAFMKDKPKQTYQIVADETGIGVDDVKRMFTWYDFNPSINASDIADLTATQRFLLESGMLAEPTDIQAMVQDMTK